MEEVTFPDQVRTQDLEANVKFRHSAAVAAWVYVAPSLALLAVFLLTFFDPLGLESASKRQSATIFYKMYAPAYPEQVREKITIVTLDDETLETRDQTWPPDFHLHGSVLSAIQSYKPSAILIDLYFLSERAGDGIEHTLEALKALNAQQIPVYVIVAERSNRVSQPIRHEFVLAESSGLVRFVSANFRARPGETPVYPLKSTDDRDSAAFALYKDVCKKLEGVKCQTIPQGPHSDIEVVWGFRPAHYNCDSAVGSELERVCLDLGGSFMERAWHIFWQTFFPGSYRPTDPMPLPYHTAVSAADLLDGTNDVKLIPVLEQRVVIYGSRMNLVKDHVYSPVHGQIDGVFAHAMALDNLLTFGSSYVTREHGEEYLSKGWVDLQPSLAVLLFSVAVTIKRRSMSKQVFCITDAQGMEHRDERFNRVVRRIILGLVVLAGLIEFFLLRKSPMNWLALLVVVHVAHRIQHWYFAYVLDAARLHFVISTDKASKNSG